MIDGRTFTVDEPQLDAIQARYAAIGRRFEEAASADERWAAIQAWEAVRKELQTWRSVVHVRFSQDTEDEVAAERRKRADQLWPQFAELEVDLMRLLSRSEHRPELEARIGGHAFELWKSRIAAFEPAIKEPLTAEATLGSRYTALRASARFELDGRTVNLSGLQPWLEHSDRAVRLHAQQLRWRWFADHADQLDTIFDELVGLRTGMARSLGYDTYTPLGYLNMSRVDYGPTEVERFRNEVLEQVVPLAAELRSQQAQRIGVDPLRYWDEPLQFPAGNPSPRGDEAELMRAAAGMFSDLDEDMGHFFQRMVEQNLMDLSTRPTKAGGGFCTQWATEGVPFVFANFNGTKGDAEVFTHELGHAYQGWSSRDKIILDYRSPTYESAEIHSMSLEFLTWPWMERFFGEEADRFRTIHLTEALVFLPYAVAVDHFQHRVYDHPDASPADRHAMWLELEERYQPWRSYGDAPGLEHLRKGGLWQRQLHIYRRPFYYIDYALAQTCALQFWLRAEQNRGEAIAAYTALCKRGGEAPFGELVRSAGVRSPFEPGCLSKVVEEARAYLLR
jgi:M3 family oligoendopeptidase